MSFRVASYSDSWTGVSQSMPRGNNQQTNQTANIRGRLGSGFIVVGTFTSNQNSIGSGTYSFVLDGVLVFTRFISDNLSPGSYNWATSIPSGFEVFPSSTFNIQAPSNAVYGIGATISFEWRVFPLQYTVVPEENEKIWVANGNIWSPAREVWVAQEVSFNNYQWTKAWEIPPPPPNPPTSLSISQQASQGGDIVASWTNTVGSSGITWELQWEVWTGFSWNNFLTNTGTSNGASQTVNISEFQLADGDQYRARIRYVSGGANGAWRTSNTITYVGEAPI